MKEQLYTIPVNEVFEGECECPLCKMKEQLERNAIEYTLGPSYMEDDVRAMTDEAGFCEKHISDLYMEKNRLGLALILSTHLQKTTKDLQALSSQSTQSGGSFFKKRETTTNMGEYVDKLKKRCFICERINNTFDRYVETIFHLYKKDPSFQEKLRSTKGFCTYHFSYIYDKAPEYLSKEVLEQFLTDIKAVYFDNMKRMQDDLEWFINKFDYRYKDEPWKNSKDALPRTILKTHSVLTDENN